MKFFKKKKDKRTILIDIVKSVGHDQSILINMEYNDKLQILRKQIKNINWDNVKKLEKFWDELLEKPDFNDKEEKAFYALYSIVVPKLNGFNNDYKNDKEKLAEMQKIIEENIETITKRINRWYDEDKRFTEIKYRQQPFYNVMNYLFITLRSQNKTPEKELTNILKIVQQRINYMNKTGALKIMIERNRKNRFRFESAFSDSDDEEVAVQLKF